MADTLPPPATTVLVNGRHEEVHTDPDTALLYVLRNHLGLKGTLRLWSWLMRGLLRSHRRAPCLLLRHPGVGRAGPGGDHRRGTGDTAAAPRGRARDCRWAGRAVRLLHLWNRDCRSCIARTERGPHRGRSARSAGRQPVPVRFARPDRARRGGGRRRTTYRPGGLPVSVPYQVARELPPSLVANPRLGDWLRILPVGGVEVRSGKVELGQGVLTALAQIVAEELDVDVTRVRMIAAATGASPDEGYTAGSLSIQHSGAALRMASAEARMIYLGVAAGRWNVPEDVLTVEDGTIAAPDGRTMTYWELADDLFLARPVTGLVEPKSAAAYRVVGTNVPRIDLPDKLAPRPHFVHDLALEGMLYGRIVRRPSRGAALLEVDTEQTMARAGVVAVVWDGNFLGVVAEREEVALSAAEGLRASATWQERPTLPDEGDLPDFLTSAPAEASVLA